MSILKKKSRQELITDRADELIMDVYMFRVQTKRSGKVDVSDRVTGYTWSVNYKRFIHIIIFRPKLRGEEINRIPNISS